MKFNYMFFFLLLWFSNCGLSQTVDRSGLYLEPYITHNFTRYWLSEDIFFERIYQGYNSPNFLNIDTENFKFVEGIRSRRIGPIGLRIEFSDGQFGVGMDLNCARLINDYYHKGIKSLDASNPDMFIITSGIQKTTSIQDSYQGIFFGAWHFSGEKQLLDFSLGAGLGMKGFTNERFKSESEYYDGHVNKLVEGKFRISAQIFLRGRLMLSKNFGCSFSVGFGNSLLSTGVVQHFAL